MIGIKGIRIDDVDIVVKENEDSLSGHYSIISSTDKVIAKQGFNSYNNIKVDMSQETKKLLIDFLASLKKDVQTMTGLVD